MQQFSKLVDMENPELVMDEVRIIVSMIFPDFDFEQVNRVFKDVVKLFHGEYPGYRACNTEYHDLRHTSDATLAFTRLIHGAVLAGESLSREDIGLGIIATLLHDTGYIQTVDDDTGTGAKYTMSHIQRSIEFMDKYFAENGFSREHFNKCSDMLKCTGLNTKIDNMKFVSPETELQGKMLGTADLLGQMADRTYLEKLLFLFYEFREAGIQDYESELDLLSKTIGFYEFTKKRFAGELGGVTKYLSGHFKARFNIDRDLYENAMEGNIQYLKHTLKHNEKDYRDGFRRAGLVDKLKENGL